MSRREIFAPDKKISISGAPSNAKCLELKRRPKDLQRRPLVLFRLFVSERYYGIVTRCTQCRIDRAGGGSQERQGDRGEYPAR